MDVGLAGLFASKPAPTFDLQRTQNSYPTQTSCGSGLAREEASKPNIHVTEPPPSRTGSLPHSIFSGHKVHIQHRTTVGAGLLAKRPAHPTSSSTVTPPSRASPLPQEKCDPTKSQVGYQAASGWTLISGAPLTTLAERRYCAVGNPAWMPG